MFDLDDDSGPEENFPQEREKGFAFQLLTLVSKDFRKIASPCPSCRKRPRMTYKEGQPITVGCHGRECLDRSAIIPDGSILECFRLPDVRGGSTVYDRLFTLAVMVWAEKASSAERKN